MTPDFCGTFHVCLLSVAVQHGNPKSGSSGGGRWQQPCHTTAEVKPTNMHKSFFYKLLKKKKKVIAVTKESVGFYLSGFQPVKA